MFSPVVLNHIVMVLRIPYDRWYSEEADIFGFLVIYIRAKIVSPTTGVPLRNVGSPLPEIR